MSPLDVAVSGPLEAASGLAPAPLPRTLPRRRIAPAQLPPGPRSPALVQMLRGLLAPTSYLDACARRYGDCFSARIPGQPPFVFFSHPDAVRDILTGDPDVFRAGVVGQMIAPLVGRDSVLVLDGEPHARQRRRMMPAFRGEHVQASAALVRDVADREIDRWPVGRRFRLHHAMQAIALDVILRAVFGLDAGEELERLRERLLALLALLDRPSAAALAIPALQVDLGRHSPWGCLQRRIRAVDDVLLPLIARRRREGTAGRPDVLSRLVETDEDAGDPHLRDQLVSLVLAGHETTATSLAWVLYRALGRPDVLARMRAELEEAEAGGAPGPLPYLDAVIREAARLHPVVGQIGRELHADARVGGVDLPAGVVVWACLTLTHRRADLWPDPERFDPDRFLRQRPGPYAFYPFGGGGRRCLGAAFALQEMRLILGRVLARVSLRVAPGYRARSVRRAVTLAPSRGLPVIADARRP